MVFHNTLVSTLKPIVVKNSHFKPRNAQENRILFAVRKYVSNSYTKTLQSQLYYILHILRFVVPLIVCTFPPILRRYKQSASSFSSSTKRNNSSPLKWTYFEIHQRYIGYSNIWVHNLSLLYSLSFSICNDFPNRAFTRVFLPLL